MATLIEGEVIALLREEELWISSEKVLIAVGDVGELQEFKQFVSLVLDRVPVDADLLCDRILGVGVMKKCLLLCHLRLLPLLVVAESDHA